MAAGHRRPYRPTTPEMASCAMQTLDSRLTLAFHVAEAITQAELDQRHWVSSRLGTVSWQARRWSALSVGMSRVGASETVVLAAADGGTGLDVRVVRVLVRVTG